ncbi:DUF397 domain-containing protein [Streptosporangium saharense]|uniref:DUF397 domain-containing protein n=1 Tax=Streptosporangium saharense TaxID=1706840 RepID=A0A7W7QVI3_9ACTN|nr:DUF397 domain-containing protein [Streptosporangium saharense]MBB4920542.1 hypothetical protein [Streptosporangium saharense]
MSPDLTDAKFHKSSLSGATNENCVEVATNLPGLVAVRDSKDPSGPALAFTPAQWRSFIGRVNTGAFDA